LVEAPGGFDYTTQGCMDWMKEVGFREADVEQWLSPESIVIGIE